MHLPLFLTGLLETKDPLRFLAIQGTLDLIKARRHTPTLSHTTSRLPSHSLTHPYTNQAFKEQLPASLSHILPPLKTALAASDPIIVATALKVRLSIHLHPAAKHPCSYIQQHTIQILQDLVLVDPLRVGPALVFHYHSLLGAGAIFQRHKDATQGGGQGDGMYINRSIVLPRSM